MEIKKYLQNNNITIRQMSLITGIPYATCNNIANDNIDLEKCQYRTLKSIANFLKTDVETLVFSSKGTFQNFRNNYHHILKSMGDKETILYILKNKEIEKYKNNNDYIRCLYLLSMVDYLSKKNDIPLVSDYDSLRELKLKKPFLVGQADNNDNCIDEFVKHNIYEGDLYDVV